MRYEPGPQFPWGVLARLSVKGEGGSGDRYVDGSLGRQEGDAASYIKRNDLGRIVQVYVEIASGFDKDARRPEYHNVLDDIRSGRIGGIAVWKLDRLSRRMTELWRVIQLLEEYGGRLLSVNDGIDTADGEKRDHNMRMFSVLAMAAQSESQSTSDRINLWHQERVRMGLVHRTWVRPFGHTEDWFGLVDAEVALLHEARERLVKGEAANAICSDWNIRGVRTTRGGLWYPEQLRYVLSSPRMIGKREYDGSLFPLNDVPPIFTEEQRQRVLDALARRTREAGPLQSRLGSGIYVCGICLYPLVAGEGKGQGRYSYRCRPKHSRPNACGKLWALGHRVDAIVENEVQRFLSDHEKVSALLYQQAEGPEVEALHQRVAELSDSKLELAAALNPPPGVPRMDGDIYFAQITTIEKEWRELHQRIALTREAALLAEILTFEDVRYEWETRPLGWKRLILKLATERILIEPRGKPAAVPGHNVFDPERVKIKFAA